MKNNNNIATIYHERHDQLKLLAGSPAKAEFLSKCVYWWQISKYKIKQSDGIWFTRTTDELAAGAGLSESSVGRYLKDFAQKGLIEKRVIKRFSRKHDQDIACLHIRITDKLLALLKTTTKKASTTHQTTSDNEQPNSKNLQQLDDTPSVNLTVPTIYNKEHSLNNTTVSVGDVNCVEKQSVSFEKAIFPIEKEIGERVSIELKEQVKGMLYNVLKLQGQKLAHNERLFTEVLFAVTNKEQFKDVHCMNHRINIAATLIRKKTWRTPKGFFNHWDIGQALKQRDEVKRRRVHQEKLERELLGVKNPMLIAEIKARFERAQAEASRFDHGKADRQTTPQPDVNKKMRLDALREVQREIVAESNYLRQMEKALQDGKSYASQEVIDSIALKLASLYEKQHALESELQVNWQDASLCA